MDGRVCCKIFCWSAHNHVRLYFMNIAGLHSSTSLMFFPREWTTRFNSPGHSSARTPSWFSNNDGDDFDFFDNVNFLFN